MKPGIYKHFKGGEYEVYGVARNGDIADAEFTSIAQHSETAHVVCLYIKLALPAPYFIVTDLIYKEPLVVYRPLYGDRRLTVRPLSMWSEHVERDDYSGPRFVFDREVQ